MSTKAERHFRATRHILPVKITVKGNEQRVDADVRSRALHKLEEEEAVREVRQALNRYYYEQEGC